MTLRALPSALALSTLLAGCVAPREPGPTSMSATNEANGQAVVTALAAPLYVVFKATACVASALIAAPSSAALALTDRPNQEHERAALSEGVGRNCSGSYFPRTY
jgi:hypothetical protein